MEEHKKYNFRLYEKGMQYNNIIMYSIAQSRGYTGSLPSNFFSSYKKRYL